jgi:hypothetical protein
VYIRPARPTAVRVLVVAALGAAALAFSAPASAAPSCGTQILNEWVHTDHVSATYPLHCYRDALNHVPEDLAVYTDIEQNILNARQQAARRGTLRTTQGHVPQNQNQSRDPQSGLYNEAMDSLSPTNANSMPLPLLILAGLSLILVAAGGAGLVTRRVKARKVPS